MIEKCKGCEHENECGIRCWHCHNGDHFQPIDTRDFDYPDDNIQEEEE